jgi:hypothetical protein
MVSHTPMMRIRLTQEIRIWLKGEARRNCRSQNGEIVFRLDDARRRAEAIPANIETPAAAETASQA